MDKTVVVERSRTGSSTALYGKVIRRTTKVKAHDEANGAASATGSCSWRPARHQALAVSPRGQRAGVGDLGVDLGDPSAVRDQALALVEILEKAK